MIHQFNCVALAPALEQLKRTVAEDKRAGMRTLIFCESRFTLDIEKAVCDAVGGTFEVDVHTFKRFLSKTGKRDREQITDQQAQMIVRGILSEKDVWNSLRIRELSEGKLTPIEAAQSMYEAISHMLCSGISVERLEAVKPDPDTLLADKVHDIAIVYRIYMEYLDGKADGKKYKDSNTSFEELPGCLAGLAQIGRTDVVFFGYQTFNALELECVKTAMGKAGNVTGIFLHEDGKGGPVYYNYSGAAADAFRELGGTVPAGSGPLACGAAEALRKGMFNPEAKADTDENDRKRIILKEAPDSATEIEFIASEIENIIADGSMRYRDIAVMVPGLNDCEREISSVFKKHGIPYYAARRYPLETHPLCTYVLSLLSCVIEGCRPEDVDDAVSSPFFPGKADQKNFFRAFLARFGNYKGSVLDEDWSRIGKLCFYIRKNHDDFESYKYIRQMFANRYNTVLSCGTRYAAGAKALLEKYHLRDKVKGLADDAAGEYPEEASVYRQVYDAVIEVLDSVDRNSGDASGADCLRMIRAGFASTKLALSVRNTDCVFVGDFNGTVNTGIGSDSGDERWAGSKVLFCARLTGDVPAVTCDDAFLSDAEWRKLCAALSMDADMITFTSARANSLSRETAAMNVCSFTDRVYLTYPTETDGKETEPSEIIYFAQKISGNAVEPISAAANAKKGRSREESGAFISRERALDLYMPDPENRTISPTTIETYFECPYKMFMAKGLAAEDTLQGSLQAVDTGTLVHDVMKIVTPKLLEYDSLDDFRSFTRETGESLMTKAPYAALDLNDSGRVRKNAMLDSLEVLAERLYNHHRHTMFKPFEEEFNMTLTAVSKSGISYTIAGRIDRVDVCEDAGMVRVIDYKTGHSYSAEYKDYYMGKKLQLELYLQAAALCADKQHALRPVASCYLPCNVEYTAANGRKAASRLDGFLDQSDAVKDVIWTDLQDGKAIDDYINLKPKSVPMIGEETFRAFLDYASQVSGQAIEEMVDGYIEPAPAEDACEYCKYRGSCGYSASRYGERDSKAADGISIACIAHPELADMLCPEQDDAAGAAKTDGGEE